MDDDDIQLEEFECPECGGEVVWRHCVQWGCDDGFIDNYDEDPINLSVGEEIEKCPDCFGTGIERWCRGCGLNITPAILKSVLD